MGFRTWARLSKTVTLTLLPRSICPEESSNGYTLAEYGCFYFTHRITPFGLHKLVRRATCFPPRQKNIWIAMSSLDQYSYCPCGNGKKIKFCKCNQHLAEMEKIHRMIVGEQNVAALDRINSDLKTMPAEPWLLAMKCELLLQLRELDSLERPLPSLYGCNPTIRWPSCIDPCWRSFEGNTEEGRRFFCRPSVIPLKIFTDDGTVALNLLETLAQRGMTHFAMLHAEMLMTWAINSLNSAIRRTLPFRAGRTQTFCRANRFHLHLMRMTHLTASGMAEAIALISNYRIAAGKTKLESMMREFGQQAPCFATFALLPTVAF